MEKLIFLDNGATSFPKPEEVYAFMSFFIRLRRTKGVCPIKSKTLLYIFTVNAPLYSLKIIFINETIIKIM